MNPWEIGANAFNTASIVFAGRNSVHTWWSGILGCGLFGVVFYEAKLYADVTLQLFFIASCIVGWWAWLRGDRGVALPVRHVPRQTIAVLVVLAALVAGGYGWLLHRYTDAYAPFVDSLVLAFSVLGQFLMVGRRVESWWCWLVVNTLAVPLYASRGLYVTAVLYVAFWVNAVISLGLWRRLAATPQKSRGASAGAMTSPH
ncbi:MAG: nicotinamide mononucleotide transporter [Acidobacteria bacterium]|nr:nicotinamide mononucleotide transporter [Acidobacteriota bacterium]